MKAIEGQFLMPESLVGAYNIPQYILVKRTNEPQNP